MTRATRRHPGSSEPPDSWNLSILESLLLAQAVYESGSDSWSAVSKILTKHALLSRPKSFFSASSCHSMYNYLMKEAGLAITEENKQVHAPGNLKLAEKHFNSRLQELKTLISSEENKFKTLAAEIEQIRTGQWDDKIKQELQETPLVGKNDEEESIAVEPSSELTGLDNSDQVTSQTSQPEDRPDESDSSHSKAKEEDEDEEKEDEEKEDEDKEDEEKEDEEREDEEREDEDKEDDSGPRTRRTTRASTAAQSQAGPSRSIRTKKQKSDMDVDTENETNDDKTDAGTPRQAFSRSTSPAEHRRNEKRKLVDRSDSPRDKKRAREESSEPVDEEDPGPHAGTRRRRDRIPPTEEQVANRKFQNVITMLFSQISQHRNGTIFHNPIKDSEAPDYHEIIKRPMDLKTIKAKIKDGAIKDSLEFQRDVYLMFANALMYNRPGSDIYNMAEEMMLESESLISNFRQTEGLLRGGNRRN